jgi:predicted house-cleaning NTP pyrophosphatase (Maf/HAM1 superfamily)
MMGLSGRYKVQVSPLDEDEVQIELSVKNYPPQDYARILAERKAQALAVTMSHAREVTLIIGSDTIVDLDGSISELIFSTDLILTHNDTRSLRSCPWHSSHPRPAIARLHEVNKPKDEADAFNMIKRLSGKWHKVHTGVAVYAVGVSDQDRNKLMFSFTDTANVKFADLSDNDIVSYIATREPMDKAGSYGIQGVGGQFGAYIVFALFSQRQT